MAMPLNKKALEDAGFSEDEIRAYQDKVRNNLINSGFSTEEAGTFVGKPPINDGPIVKFAKETFDSVLNEVSGDPVNGERPGFSELVSRGVESGFQSSVTGLLKRGALPDKTTPEDAPFVESIASQMATLAGDFPFMVAGSIAGGGAALAVGQAGPQALLPEEIVTVPAGAVAGAFALPAGMRESLIKGYEDGSIDSFGEFWARTAAVFLETAKGATTGFATGKAGELVKPGIAKLAAEVGTMVTVGKSLNGEVPDPMDFVEGVVIIGGVKMATKTAGGTIRLAKQGKQIVGKLQDRYIETGQKPSQVVEEIQSEPIARERLFSRKPKVVKEEKPQPPNELSAEELAIQERISINEHTSINLSVNELYRQFVDRMHPLKTLTDTLSEGKDIPIGIDPYKQARLNVAATSKANLFLEHEVRDFSTFKVVGPGLRQVLSPVEKSLDKFRVYAVSRRAAELNQRGIETGIPLSEAMSVVKSAPKEFTTAFEGLVTFQENVLKYLKDSGVVSEEMFSAMREANKDYVPFFRMMTEGEKGAGGSVRNPLKRIKGSDLTLVDPLESVIKNTYAYLRIAENNAVGRSLVELSETSSIGSKLVKKVDTRLNPVKVTSEEIQKSLKTYEEELGFTLTPEDMTIFRPSFQQLTKNQIAIFREGKREIYEVDPQVAEIVRSLDVEAAHLFTKILSVPAKTLRAGAILNPEFFLRNTMRDNITAAVYSTSGFRPFVDAIHGATSLVKQDKSYRDWVMGGGAQATLVSLDRKYLQTNLKRLTETTSLLEASVNVAKSPLELLRVASELFENATRIGEFKRSTRGDTSKAAIQEGSFRAREVTLDFSKMGSSMHAVNMITAFWNARIQGYDRLARAFKENPASATAKAVAMITTPSVLLWMANHNDERYKELAQWQKDLFWIVMTDDHIYRIPKPFELGILFGTFAEHLLDKMADSDVHLAQKLFDSVKVDSLSSFMPNFMVAPIEQATNKSLFRDSPLVPYALENALPEDRYTIYSTELSKAIGRLIAMAPGMKFSSFASPIIIENYIRQWSGGLGMYTLQIADKALRSTGALPDPPKPDDTLADVPFIKGFIVRYPSASAQSL